MCVCVGKVMYGYIGGSGVWKCLGVFEMIYGSIWRGSDWDVCDEVGGGER